MELATDIMAILGFMGIGRIFPSLLIFIGGGDTKTNKSQGWMCAISFGLIAASIVLG
jgi:hypothetical protein